MFTLVLVLVFANAVTWAFLIGAPSDEQVRIWKRMRTIRPWSAQPEAAEEDELAKPFSERVLRPTVAAVGRALGRLAPSQQGERVRRRLLAAGLTGDLAWFVGVKIVSGLIGAGLGALVVAVGGSPALLALGIPFLSLAGWALPEVWLRTSVVRRQRAIREALPDVLDLLSISVDAGLGFDGAVQKVAEKFPEPTSSEFNNYLKEVRLGSARADALRGLASRVGLAELRSFAAAVIQAEQLGASLARVLRVQSDQMRQRRRQQAEERAMKAPIKLMLPLVGFIFPTIFIVLLGPAVLMIVGQFSGR